MDSSTTSIDRVTALDPWFSIDDRPQVHSYLDRHPHLLPLLLEVAVEVRRFFPPEDALCLHAIDDADTQTEQLYAIVCTSLPRDEAEERLDRLDEEWWLDAVEQAEGDLTIDVRSR